MNFARLLLESYSKLNEQGEDVINAITAAAGGLGKGDGTRNTITPPNGGNAGQVGLNDKGEPFIEGGPMQGFKKANVTTADQETIAILQNWWAGAEEGEGEVIDQLHPMEEMYPILKNLGNDKRSKKEEGLEIIQQIEELSPGAVKHIITFYKNMFHKTEDGKDSSDLLFSKHEKSSDESELLSNIFGGGRFKFCARVLKEMRKGEKVIEKVKKDGSEMTGIFSQPTAEDFNGSLESLAKMSEAYKISRDDPCDPKLKDLHANVKHLLRKNTSKDHPIYFFRSNASDNYGISFESTPMNKFTLMMDQYEKNIADCGEDSGIEGEIPSMTIKSNSSKDSGNTNNLVGKISESLKMVSFHLTNDNFDEARKLFKEISSDFSEKVILALQNRLEIANDETINTEAYSERDEMLRDLGIEDSDSLLEFIRTGIGNFVLNSNLFFQTFKPDFAMHSAESTTKGDKSDLVYLYRSNPSKNEGSDKFKLPNNAFIEVSVGSLKESIRNEAIGQGFKEDEKVWIYGSALKTYSKEGPIKLGETKSLAMEGRRLVGDPSLSKEDIEHGNKIFDLLQVDEESKAGARAVITKLNTVSDLVQTLFTPNTSTNSMSSKEFNKFVDKSLGEIISDANLNINKEDQEVIKELTKQYTESTAISTLVREGSGGLRGKMSAIIERSLRQAVLYKGLNVDESGNFDKKDQEVMNHLTAFAALTATTGSDTTNIDPVSEIHILQTGNTYRHKNNKIITKRLKKLLDKDSEIKTLFFGRSRWTVEGLSLASDITKDGLIGSTLVSSNHLRKSDHPS